MAAVFIEWAEQDTSGIRILDEQHKGVVSIINSFFFHRDDREIERVLVPTYETLANFAKIHFITEEKLMVESDYPDLLTHKEDHERVLRELGTVERECRKARDAYQLLTFMKHYWLEHMRDHDHGYFAHLKHYFGEQY